MAQPVSAVRTVARVARVLERGCHDLTLPQYRVLSMVEAGGQRATVLAGLLALAKPTVTAAVDGLVERGFLCRGPVPGDRRAARITITPAGRRALQAAEGSMGRCLDQVLERVASPDDVLAALAAVETALDRLLAERVAEGVR